MKFVFDVLRGIVIGIANIIPGVSGGTMMVSMGIYDTIISCITNIFKQFKKSFRTLLPYFLGMAIGIGGLAIILKLLFEKYPLPTNTAFIGLILGGLPAITRQLDKKKINVFGIGVGLLFFALIIGMQFMGTGAQREIIPSIGSALFMVVLGAVASATMVIPGVSGSMVMMLLGYYQGLLGSISTLVKGLGNFSVVVSQLSILVPFGIGVIIGIFVVAKLLEWLFQHYFTYTYCGILGLVLASPVVVLMGVNFSTVNLVHIILAIVTFIIGFFIAKGLSSRAKA